MGSMLISLFTLACFYVIINMMKYYCETEPNYKILEPTKEKSLIAIFYMLMFGGLFPLLIVVL